MALVGRHAVLGQPCAHEEIHHPVPVRRDDSFASRNVFRQSPDPIRKTDQTALRIGHRHDPKCIASHADYPGIRIERTTSEIASHSPYVRDW
jgi:hypothetical protein